MRIKSSGIVFIICMALIITVLLYHLRLLTIITEHNREIGELRKENHKMKIEVSSKKIELEDKIDLKVIEERAIKTLNMERINDQEFIKLQD